jgi:hypothetical protein
MRSQKHKRNGTKETAQKKRHKRKAAVSRKVVERILPPAYKVSRLRESSDQSMLPNRVRTPQKKRGSQ